MAWPNDLDEFPSRKGQDMTIAEFNTITGQELGRAPTQEEINALVVRARRALAVRRAVAVREIQEQAQALDETDRLRLIKALEKVS
jgi:hypothetical protein